MQLLFSMIFLIVTTGLILWWSLFDVPLALSPEETEKQIENSTPNNSITDPLDKARDAKQSIESNNPFALDLSGQNLTSVPKSVFEKVNLENLNLSHNALSGALQAEVRNLQNLKDLDLSSNNFTGVPAEIGQLKNLEVLNLSNNKLTGLPYELGNLSHLRILISRETITLKQILQRLKKVSPKLPQSSLTNFMTSQIDVATFKKILEASAHNPSFDFINVCTTDEYNEMHIQGVRSVPLDTLAEHLNEFSTKERIYIHCKSGRRGMFAVETLTQLGVRAELINVEGGILAWIDAGFKTNQ